ncbi:hypothetical protein B0H14DRAFT_3751481 [Mycena olivaceomarginata]|nr:hypothetical protein B0H14DRAFT_3751481 [Mycena olivaceomarginata]
MNLQTALAITALCGTSPSLGALQKAALSAERSVPPPNPCAPPPSPSQVLPNSDEKGHAETVLATHSYGVRSIQQVQTKLTLFLALISRAPGILVRVTLVAIIADHPAMCKLCGFADHSHTAAPCPKCTVKQAEIFTEESLKNGFPARDGEVHRQLCYRYKELSTEDERAEFFRQYGAQWTEFARLYYFDLVKYTSTIIDPMHNLLLGKVFLG